MTGHFEAKKHAYRQTQDGIVVSFVIHPNDVDSGFAVAPLGTRYMIGFAEIGDDDKIVPAERGRVPDSAAAPAQSGETTRPPSAGTTAKDRKPFASLPLSQRAAIRCNDSSFQDYIEQEWADQWMSHGDIAAVVREVCGCVASRAEMNVPGSKAALGWRDLEAQYQAWLTDQRFAEARR